MPTAAHRLKPDPPPTLSAAGRNVLRRAVERRRPGLTIGALASELGISRKHLSQVLNGRAPLTGTLAARLPAALGLPPELVGALLKRPRATTTARPPARRARLRPRDDRGPRGRPDLASARVGNRPRLTVDQGRLAGRRRAVVRTPMHPGEILADGLEELRLTSAGLARTIGVPANRISRIIAGKRNLTADAALRLGRYLGTSAEFWMNLQKTYELDLTR